MAFRLVKANEATAARRRVYFDIRDGSDGITPITTISGGQPQISTNGGSFTNTGIGTLTHIGVGRYYADVTQAAVANAGDVILTRFKSAVSAETPGNMVVVVAFDPYDAAALGLTNLDVAVSSRLATAGYMAPANSDIQAARKILEADLIVDTNTNPWELVWLEKNTGGLGVGTELLRKEIRDTAGGAITSTIVVPGQQVST